MFTILWFYCELIVVGSKFCGFNVNNEFIDIYFDF